MAYYLACQSNRFAAIGTVTGSMSVDMYNACNPQHPIPVLHIHGTDDSTNPYEGTSTMKGIDETILFWVNENNCNLVPVVTAVPDINATDNATAERSVYSGGTNGHTVELFKVTGGGHSWPGWPVSGSSATTCMDFDGCKEIWRFFSQYESVASVQENKPEKVHIWPNPASENVTVEVPGYVITEITVRDLRGRIIERKKGQGINSLDVYRLKAGSYILEISGEGFNISQKLVIANN